MKMFYLGADVSKEKLDLCLMRDSKLVEELVVKNEITSIQKEISLLMDKHAIAADDLLLCGEYTGQYTYPLCCVCEQLGLDLWLENPYTIKHSCGLQRGKNDRLDARKIASYACRFADRAKLFKLPEKIIATLRLLVSELDLYVCDRGKYQGQLTDQKRFMDKEDYERKSQRLNTLIEGLNTSIGQVEQEIRELIESDSALSGQLKLLCSIDGVGERTAVKMIVETNAFKDFQDPRKFCCHAGVAPFSYTSGSSIRSRNRVSHRADKSIKSLLHMGALTAATRMKGELHEYYLKKVSEGKNKMSVLNAVRAKLVHRMFAVIKNNKLYENNYQNALA
jgi:transposase